MHHEKVVDSLTGRTPAVFRVFVSNRSLQASVEVKMAA